MECYWPADVPLARLRAVSFMKRAREAAEAAADQAHAVAGVAAGQAQAVAGLASRTAADPATQEKLGQQARSALGAARRGVSTVVERIDPGVLADLIVKATALQEMTNASLREKRSPYRISEVSITASIPPGVSFAIGRLDDAGEVLTGSELPSAELVDDLSERDEAVISLDGTSLTQEELAGVRAVLAEEASEELNLP
jgi:hypothetical protein